MTVHRAAELLAAARKGLALTGAGVSAESGIPTFRGDGGLWTKYDPVKVASIDAFMHDPAAYWRVSKERGGVALAARPNAGHFALTALEAAGILGAIVTQNTDGLHQDSGSRRVIEVHGSSRTVQCLDCGTREPRFEVQARLNDEMPPRCRMCGGTFLKPTVVLFGEPMPAQAIRAHARPGCPTLSHGCPRQMGLTPASRNMWSSCPAPRSQNSHLMWSTAAVRLCLPPSCPTPRSRTPRPMRSAPQVYRKDCTQRLPVA